MLVSGKNRCCASACSLRSRSSRYPGNKWIAAKVKTTRATATRSGIRTFLNHPPRDDEPATEEHPSDKFPEDEWASNAGSGSLTRDGNGIGSVACGAMVVDAEDRSTEAMNR